MITTYLTPEQVPPALRGSYTGRQFKAVTADSMQLQDTYWSGGTRSTYHMVCLATGERFAPKGIAAPHHFGGTLEGVTVEIKPGYVLVEHSMFCGKDMGLTFHTNPADVAALLPAPVELTDDERTVLAATAGLKSSYGGIKNFRFVEASHSTGITLERWDAAKAMLISRAMLNKSGAITPAGRNAVGSYRLTLVTSQQVTRE